MKGRIQGPKEVCEQATKEDKSYIRETQAIEQDLHCFAGRQSSHLSQPSSTSFSMAAPEMATP